ncbi:meiosis inhibitor protein 1 isoform X3 [Sebastes umbrosus]|uniref:meiosis inhibitor protein 1 isoform X3 n=1 Tax=Sebastes umbrosus TaxID=72105 RepID=UPI00189D6DA8|nr:meiosis inhibitor protein 1 isoform X3 [Sebastes umbrosus]
MTSVDIINDKIHFRHDPKWSGRLVPAEGGGLLLCVACVIEMIDSEDIASVRKSFALSGISGVLKCSPGALRELLRQDHRVSLHFTASLLGMLHTMKDPATLEKVDQVLVQLLLELQCELSYRFVLDEIHKQLSDQLCVKGFQPTFNFLGNLVEAVPNVAHSLVTQYVPLLEHLCSAMLYPDEALKASALYVWIKLFGTAGGSVAQSLPSAIRERVCILLLQTLANASSPQLINNCVGLLWLLVQLGEAVSVLMNSPGNQIMCHENQDIHTNNGQNQEQQSPDQCPLPLILKKLLMSGDETLQATSARCIAFVLVHSPSHYSPPFIKADVPEFLFDRLASSTSEVLLWSAYSCLVLLTNDPLFFSQCHSVYGIESLVRSLKETLQLTNLDVPKQGLLLLTEILERQPPSERLFPSGSGFVAVSEAVLGGVSSSCLLVAIQAATAASALFRLNHQSRPVQYGKIEGLIEAITDRFFELALPSPAHRRSSRSLKRSDPNSQTTKSEKFLLQALVCFQAACRLAEECASEPVLKENTFTAPSKHSHTQDSLESLCQCLLRCCDFVWIPTVIRMCEHAPNPQILQYFYSILSSQFTLLPSLMPVFANKLASSGFYRLPLEHKGLLCAGNRHPYLNTSCCGFLQKLSMCLLFQSDPASGACQRDVEEVENLLLYNLPSLCYRLSDWPSLLHEEPVLQLCEYKGPRATQYCLVIMLHLALQQGDRLLPDQTVFSSVLWLLHSVQAQGSCGLPRSVLRSALYLLAVTQDKSPNLDGPPLNCISKALSSCQSFSSLYIHHPALLHFICRYPDLAEKFGPLVLELWLTKQAQHTEAEQTMADTQEKGEKRENSDQEPDTETMELLTLIEKYPAVILILLDMVCTREVPLAERALAVLEVLLRGQRHYEADLCADLRPALLQALQRHSVENMSHGLGQGHTAQAVNSLPLVLKLLCAMQASDPPSLSSYSKMDGVHFKLLYHVSNIAGRLKPTDTGSLLPAFSYLYCCLSLSPAHCTDRAVSVLLSNSGLMDQLQTVLSSSSSSSSSTPSLSPSACPPSALLCCSHLLLSYLITLQHVHSAQVQKSISWSLDSAVQRLLVQKRNTDNLLLVSYLRLLQALLDADLASAVLRLSTGPGLVGPRPLGVEDGALYPLGSRGAQCLSTALSGLLLQKHELLLRASVNCLSSLLGFLQRKSPTTAKYVVCQPWTRFLVYCLLSSGEICRLHPAILRLITILLQHGSTVVLWEPDLLQVMEAVERRGVKELSEEAAQALRLLLSQIQIGVLQPPLTEEHQQRVAAMMESLNLQTPSESCSPSLPSNVLRVGDVSICLSDFTVTAG